MIDNDFTAEIKVEEISIAANKEQVSANETSANLVTGDISLLTSTVEETSPINVTIEEVSGVSLGTRIVVDHTASDPNQHTIGAITGLREELDNIKSLKTVYSDKPLQANYYKWEGNNTYDTHGYFVSLVPGESTIKICDGPDIFGVTVNTAGFVGNQNSTTPRDKDNSYALVVTSGLIDVRCESTVAEGDYIVSNAHGVATKTTSGCGYKVIAISDDRTHDPGVLYATIALGVQACTTDVLGKNLQYLETRVDNNETNIAAAMSTANEAYYKANECIVSNGAMSDKVDGALDVVDDMSAEVGNLGAQVSSAVLVAAQAKAISESAVTSAESARVEAVDKANEALDKAGEIEKTVEPINSWTYTDPVTGETNTGATYFAEYVKNGLSTKAEMETVSNLDKENKLLIEKNAENYTQMLSSIDKYSVGEYSQAYGLTLAQSRNILKEGMVYIPTKHGEVATHAEEYKIDDTNMLEREFTSGFYYVWTILEDGEYMWSEAIGEVWFGTEQPAGDRYTYWYDGDNLYLLNGDKWTEVATLAGNVNNRITSMIRQTANEIALEVTNARGSAASLGTRISDTESEVQSLALWSKGGDKDGEQYNLATIKQTADGAGASIAQVVKAVGEDGEVSAASIVAAVNGSDTSVVINADHIKFDGFVSFANKSDVDEVKESAVYDTKVEYALSSSDTEFVAVDGDAGKWSTTAPEWQEDCYMWQKTTITKGDESTASTQTCIQGAQGSDGSTPFVGDNGNWWIGNDDTGIKAEGTDGKTPTVEINNSGYWVINGTATTIKAEGSDAPKVVSEEKQFHTSDSSVTAPDKDSSGWATVPMNYEKGKYLWTRSVYTMDKGDPIKGDAYLDKNFTTISNWCKENHEAYIDGANIYAGSVTAVQIAADTITADKIATDAITSRNYYTKDENGDYTTTKSGEGMKLNLADGTWDSEHFKIDSVGAVTATEGTIANWDISSNRIYKDTILLNTDDSFKVPVLKGLYTPWPEYSTVGIAAGYDYYEGTEKVVNTYSAGATVEFTYDTSIGAYKSTNPVYLQLPFIYSGELSNDQIGIELQNIYLLWYNAYGWNNELLDYASTGTTGYVDSSQVVVYLQKSGALLFPAGSIISGIARQTATTPRVRLQCEVKLTFNGEQCKYLSAPLKITHDGEILANKIITMDNPLVLTSSAFERAGGGGNRLELNNNTWTWYGETDSVGANIGTSILGGYVYSSFGSDIIKFYPVLDPDNFSLSTWNNKYPAVDLFTNPTFVGNSNGISGKTDPVKDVQYNAVAVRANGGWQFTNSVKFEEDVQFNSTVMDSGGSTVHTSDYNAKNSIESQPEVYSQLFDKFNPVIFKYNNGTSGRYHMGLIAQDVEDSMVELGISSNDFAALCYEEDENGNKSNYGLRYTELISMCIKEIQDLKARVEELENKLNTTQND